MAKYFSEREFAKCTPPCKMSQMSIGFLSVLDAIRERAGIPIVLNSAYRSKAYEKKNGRSGNSAHTRGLAVDVRCNTSANRYKIVEAAMACGINRIGVGKTFVHIDVDTSLPQNVIFDYYE